MNRHFIPGNHIDNRAAEQTVAPPMTVNALMSALVAELEDGGIPDPTGEALTLGFVWADLCRLAGEEPPAAIAALLDEVVAA